jgi:hypothetical protein
MAAKSITPKGIKRAMLHIISNTKSTKFNKQRTAQVEQQLHDWWAAVDHRDRPVAARLLLAYVGELQEISMLMFHQVTLLTGSHNK